MEPFVANTDRAWFDFLSARAEGGRLDEVNFWQPKALQPMKNMSPGEPVFFRLKRPTYAIAGCGFFAHFIRISIEEAWKLFGWRNGDDSRISFLTRLSRYRREDLSRPENRLKPLGCFILREARFWPDYRWIPWSVREGFAKNVVQGATVREPALAARLMAQLGADPAPADLAGHFEIVEVDDRAFVDRTSVRREGQGTFRARLLDAYGRCAITGERTQPVLDAAHIQPYLGPASNHVQNGLLLTKEFHELFDRGYVTVTPDYEVRVSEALRNDWQNGVRYYQYDRQPLRRLPAQRAAAPSRDALAWHGERVFLR